MEFCGKFCCRNWKFEFIAATLRNVFYILSYYQQIIFCPTKVTSTMFCTPLVAWMKFYFTEIYGQQIEKSFVPQTLKENYTFFLAFAFFSSGFVLFVLTIYIIVYLVVRLRHRQFFYNSLRSICKFISVVSVMDIFIFNSGIMIFF